MKQKGLSRVGVRTHSNSFTLDKFFVSCNTKNKKTKEKVLSHNFSKPFCLLFFVDPTPCFAKGAEVWGLRRPCHPEMDPFDGQSKDLGSFSHLEKEHHFFIQESILQNGQHLPHQAPKAYLLPPFLFELIFSFFQNLKNINIFYVLKSLLPVSVH